MFVHLDFPNNTCLLSNFIIVRPVPNFGLPHVNYIGLSSQNETFIIYLYTILAALRRPYCMHASPRFPVNVIMGPGNAFPTRALTAANTSHLPTSGLSPAFIAITPTTKLKRAKQITGIM